MDKDTINRTIAEACGVEPQLIEWWAWKPDDTGGSIIMSAPTKWKVEEWIENHPQVRGYSPKPFYRYPDYLNDLNACHIFERDAFYHVGDYCRMLTAVTSGGKTENMTQYNLLHATAEQRCEAFLKTLSLWTPTGEENE